MEEFTSIISAVSNVGFPVVMCLLFYLYTMRLQTNHDKEMNSLKETIQNNTQVLTELSTMIKIFIQSKQA